METKFNFNSQVCTSKVQSERLLALGLKPETADMVLVPSSRHDGSDVIRVRKSYLMEEDAIPAWSMHRLLDMAVESPHKYFTIFIPAAYNDIISHIEWLIKEGYFNKEYLEE